MGSLAEPRAERTLIGGSLEISRMINGLWQLAGGHDKDIGISQASEAMEDLCLHGLDTFDMADHYGDAELVVGRHNTTSTSGKVSFTKWCPQENGVKTFANAEAAVNLALTRMDQKSIDLLQYHAWDFSDDTYLHNLEHLRDLQRQGVIKLIGLTNTNAAHLEMLLDSGIPIATNQVPTNVIDRRLTRGRLNRICVERDVGILAYGTLLGGFLSEKWLDQPEPTKIDQLNWSLQKYLRFIWAAGGWAPFQAVLRALNTVALRHSVSISAVATRFVLDIPSVKAVIVGTRLSPGSEAYVARNLQAFSFKLTDDDMKLIEEAQQGLQDVPGDCGDEYRRPPFLTASGDRSHHLTDMDQTKQVREAIAAGKRVEFSTGTAWEPIAGYCRAVRTGNSIHVSGTTASSPVPTISVIGGKSARSQAVWILDIIEGALKALDASLSDVVRTRIMVSRADLCDEVSRVHGHVFANAGVRPANTFVVAGLIGDEFLVEIEAYAEVGHANNDVVRLTKT